MDAVRWLAVTAPVAFALVLGSLFLPWGHKTAVEEHCEVHWETGRECDHADLAAAYLPLRMDLAGSTWTTDDGDVEDVRVLAGEWTYAATPAHPEGVTPVLLAGGPVMVLGSILMIVATAGALFPSDARVWFERFAVGGWATMAVGVSLFLVGVGYHALTWSAWDVEAWRPGWGLLPGLLAVAVGAGLVRWMEHASGGGPLPALPGAARKDGTGPDARP